MLRIISGPARSGKTRRILDEIKGSDKTGLVLLTPEQSSHEAERALAAHCGAEVNLRAEVLSFTRLCSRVFTELGGSAEVVPDRGAKLLLMSQAVAAVSSKLKVYASRERRAEFLESLLDAREELARNMTGAECLGELAELAGGSVAEKLGDLSLICAAFDALLAQRLSDPRERLERLADLLPGSAVGSGGFYIDGFTDFTALELKVVEALLSRGGDVTVTLCRSGSEDAHFAIANMTYHRLLAMAKERGVPAVCETANYVDETRAPALARLCEGLFDYGSAPNPENDGSAILVAADSIFSECELAAARVLAWMKAEPELRWRDIAVAARDFNKYESIAGSVFALYGVPVFNDRREDASRRGVFALILAALDVVTGGWRREDVFRCLKTGLAGLLPDEVGELENYCVTWTVRGESAWKKEWAMNPRGFSEMSDHDRAKLERINALRERAAAPLLILSGELKEAKTAGAVALAIYDYMEAAGLSRTLSERAAALRREGDSAGADALGRDWELLVSALEQFEGTLGEAEMSAAESVKLFALLVSTLSSGSIPTALDSVSLGELTRLRGRRVKKLIILGAEEGSLPMPSSAGGVFSREERQLLSELGLELSSVQDEELCREFSAIYMALSAAGECVYVSWPSESSPSFLAGRMKALCGAEVVSGASLKDWAAAQASEPLFRLSLSGDESPKAGTARAIAGELWGERYQNAADAVNAPRGSLGETSVKELYGEQFNVTASKVEKFSVCRFAYFMRYGLRAKERARSAIDAPEFGNFVHYVMENMARDAGKAGGFRAIGVDGSMKLAEDYVKKYVDEVMNGFEGKSSRFRYLFARLKSSVLSIARDVAEEFINSSFSPMDFELDFSAKGDLPPIEVDCGEVKLRLEGKVDRVDGWIDKNNLYLRVADYKTGKTKFSLTDVWYGKGLQMLIYLFALEKEGARRYGSANKIVPAGVLYSPARDVLLSMPRDSSDEEIDAARRKLLTRSGLILDDPDVIEAMEPGDAPVRIPVKFKDGAAVGSIATAAQLGRLAAYVENTLKEMGREVRSGSILANPLKNPGDDPCVYCEFASACDFREEVDKERIKTKLKDAEFWNKI